MMDEDREWRITQLKAALVQLDLEIGTARGRRILVPINDPQQQVIAAEITALQQTKEEKERELQQLVAERDSGTPPKG